MCVGGGGGGGLKKHNTVFPLLSNVMQMMQQFKRQFKNAKRLAGV